MFSDVSDTQKARANLILVSMAVILFIHGKGTFNGSSFLGGSITFNESLALPIAGTAIFYFIVWRFLLSSGDAIKDFAWDFNNYIYSSNIYKQVFDHWVKTVEVPDVHLQLITDSPLFSKYPRASGYFPPKISNIFLPSSLIFQYHQNTSTSNKPYFPAIPSKGIINKEITKDNEVITNNVSFFNYLRLQKLIVVSFLKAIFLKRAFTDLIFPFLIGYYATILLTITVSTYLAEHYFHVNS